MARPARGVFRVASLPLLFVAVPSPLRGAAPGARLVEAPSPLPGARLFYSFRVPFSFLLASEIEIFDKKIIAKKGDLVLIPANTVHSCALTEIKYMKKAWCHFTIMSGKENFFENLCFPFIISVPDKALIESLFDKLLSAQKSAV